LKGIAVARRYHHEARLLKRAGHVRRQDGGGHDVGIGGGEQSCLRLSVEGDVDRNRVALGQVKSGARKAEQPRLAGIQPDHQNDTIVVDRGGPAMGERAATVVGEGAAFPLTDMDVAVRSRGI
jgi:hypothetical protein